MKEIKNELYCRDCGFETVTEHSEYVCPECAGLDVFNCSFITCDCGERVYTNHFTNECPECGKFYNAFGQELAPPEEWDDDDRYDAFGPQEDW